jgi:23S rRNA (adenine2503-C2)-methyltransferase
VCFYSTQISVGFWERLCKKMLLVSYMGCGEPLLNWDNVISSMVRINNNFSPCRFAIATLIPAAAWYHFFDSIHYIKDEKLDVKIHLSLHFTREDVRKGWMPAAMPIEASVAALEFYRKFTGQSVEVHYALIDDVNDGDEEAGELGELLQNRDIPVKFLQYNKRSSLNCIPSSRVSDFMYIVGDYGVRCEYYIPPGLDVGASCGQFLLDYYMKYNARQ